MLLTLATSILISCAGVNNQAQLGVIHEKAQRIDQGKVLGNGMPNYIINGSENFKLTRNKDAESNRAPASNDQLSLKNTELYFFSLYSQFRYFEQMLQLENKRNNICPQFHHALQVNESLAKERQFTVVFKQHDYISISNNVESFWYFPELSLPIDSDDDADLVYEKLTKSNAKDLIFKALTTQYEKIANEVDELCERGTSNNLYVFQNFIDYVKDHQDFTNSIVGMKAMLKLPIFSNYYLLSMLTESNQWKMDDYLVVYSNLHRQLFSKIQMSWVQQGLVADSKKRGRFDGIYSLNQK
jgi:hypothetical protein